MTSYSELVRLDHETTPIVMKNEESLESKLRKGKGNIDKLKNK